METESILFKMVKKGVKKGSYATFFQKGYKKQIPLNVPDDVSCTEQPIESSQQPSTSQTCAPPQSPSEPVPRNYSRLTREVYELGVRGKDEPPSILRPKKNSVDPEEENSDKLTSNRLVNMDTMSSLLSHCYAEHLNYKPRCRLPEFIFLKDTERYQGLGSSVQTKCVKCGFLLSHRDLYKKVSSEGRGRSEVEVNKRLGHFMSTNKMAVDTVIALFSVLDMRAPTEKTIMKHTYKCCDIQETLGKDLMIDNQKKVAELMTHNQDVDELIISGDTLYNNPAKGGRRQPGTQCSSPFMEYYTNENLVVGLQTFSQFCVKCKNGSLDKPGHKCTKSYPKPGALSDAEKLAAAKVYSRIKTGPLENKVSTFLGDGCNQQMTGINNKKIEKVRCTQHLKRGMRKKCYDVFPKLSKGLFGTVNPAGRKRALATTLCDRVAIEMKKARKLYKLDSDWYKFMRLVRLNTLFCISGLHAFCDKASLVCRPKRNKKNTEVYNLTLKDIEKLQPTIDYRSVIICLCNKCLISKSQYLKHFP